jgi:hypothetical protein
MIEVKQATLADLVTVSSILKEAAGWLQATGRVMWRDEALILSALRASTPERRTPERRTPNAKRQTPNAKRQTPNAKRLSAFARHPTRSLTCPRHEAATRLSRRG